ncbi:unnamed protein product [Linum trigynum]|uniref:Uncharacterized protein n=1 Tax=Linum trigynum TaxID=586398 RepID=A0AAV2GE66_9ROSI
MADIAILVAEEYERRLNRERRSSVSAAASERKVDCARLVEINANWESTAAAAAGSLRSKMVELVKNKKVAIEPKSQISLAASTGYFSA